MSLPPFVGAYLFPVQACPQPSSFQHRMYPFVANLFSTIVLLLPLLSSRTHSVYMLDQDPCGAHVAGMKTPVTPGSGDFLDQHAILISLGLFSIISARFLLVSPPSAQTRTFEHDRRHGARPLFTRTFRTLHHFLNL